MKGDKRKIALDQWRDLESEGRFKILADEGKALAEVRIPQWPGWMASGLFALHENRLVLMELRIFPAEDRNPPGWGAGSRQEVVERLAAATQARGGRSRPEIGEWSRDPSRLDDLGIHDGIAATMLKDIRTGPLFDLVQSFAGFVVASMPEAAVVYEQMSESPNPRRQRRDDLHWAEWARRIHEKTASPTRSPITDVAEDVGFDRSKVRDIAHECRSHGFLGLPLPGRGGGFMTDKARSVLADAGKRKRGKK